MENAPAGGQPWEEDLVGPHPVPMDRWLAFFCLIEQAGVCCWQPGAHTACPSLQFLHSGRQAVTPPIP